MTYMYIMDTTHPPKLTQNPSSNQRKRANPWKMERNNAMYRSLGKNKWFKTQNTDKQTTKMLKSL